MKETGDVYKTLAKASEEILFKEKNSKFFASAFPVDSETEIQEFLEEVRIRHKKAGHHCYAWQLGKEEESYHFKVNDDGEPGNSAGMPIFGQIQSYGLTNVLVVVTRYFGGVKLGVGGLIQAYKTAALMALDASDIVERTIDVQFELTFDYPELNKVMRLIKENNLEVIDQKMTLSCKIFIAVRKSETEKTLEQLEALFKVDVKKVD
ncbi:MAG TPA: YigZ family protein [Salinimicrobium sp.]|nr:YigZ family protein [Salinimicrobium sp.]